MYLHNNIDISLYYIQTTMAHEDPEFFPDSDTMSICSGESISNFETNSTCQSFDSDDDDDSVQSITNDEYTELTLTAYEIMDDYAKCNLLTMSSPQFYTNMADYVVEILYTDIQCSTTHDPDVDLLDTSTLDEIREFVSQTMEVWKEIYYLPMRSCQSYVNDSCCHTNTSMKTKIAALQAIVQPEQKTREWYEFRYNLITASNLWKALGTQSQINSLIYEKCKPMEADVQESRNTYAEGPMHWGVKYEPVTVQIYEHMFHTRIGEFGCIPHATYPYIGASPDGINIDPSNPRYGRMLEIKNIVNRDITGIPKEEYWIQTQIQMETCDLDECDFVETRIKEYENEDAFYSDCDSSRLYRGVILHFIERPPMIITEQTLLSNKPYYVYMPLTNALTKDSICAWSADQRRRMMDENKVLFAQKYWYLDEISCVLIQRNREWFASAVPHIQRVWDTIVRERVEGYEHRASKKRTVKDRSMSIMSDEGDYGQLRINNIAPLCLIRLDENGNVM